MNYHSPYNARTIHQVSEIPLAMEFNGKLFWECWNCHWWNINHYLICDNCMGYGMYARYRTPRSEHDPM